MKESLKGRSAWNNRKYLPEEQVSSHALYMREWRKKRQSLNWHSVLDSALTLPYNTKVIKGTPP